MDEQNTTHPNAYRMEAAEKRVQAGILADEANELDAKARELEKAATVDEPAAANEVPAETKAEDKPKDKKFLGK
jgi:hypothetical protein